jgi:diguanylate cyclase (GGDEF)-like protein
MFRLKKWWHIDVSWMQQVQLIVNQEPIAWSCILLSSMLFSLPYMAHELTIWTLGPYTTLSLLPITLSALLRARRGALVAWFICMLGLFVKILTGLGSHWLGWQLTFPCVAISELTIALVAGQLRTLALRLHQSYTQLQQAHATIQLQALTDGLTQLPNHGAIIERIESELQLCRTSQRNCVVIFADIDHFKQINDMWGHAAGDAALHAVGQCLHESIRQDDSIGRYGGEEFAILLSNIDQAEAVTLAERLRRNIAELACLWQQEETPSVVRIPVTASFGLAAYPLDGLTANEMLHRADTAMYIAKHAGRNRVCLPDDTVDMTFLQEEKHQLLPEYTEQEAPSEAGVA